MAGRKCEVTACCDEINKLHLGVVLGTQCSGSYRAVDGFDVHHAREDSFKHFTRTVTGMVAYTYQLIKF